MYAVFVVVYNQMASTQFDGLLTTLLGYILIAVLLACLHCLMSLLRFKKYL